MPTPGCGRHAFRFLGARRSTGRPVRCVTSTTRRRNVTVLEGDTNGDKVADFGIELTGNMTLTAADFVVGSLLVPLTLTGTGSADTLTGGELNDTLSGLGGNDTLTALRATTCSTAAPAPTR